MKDQSNGVEALRQLGKHVIATHPFLDPTDTSYKTCPECVARLDAFPEPIDQPARPTRPPCDICETVHATQADYLYCHLTRDLKK